MNILKEVYMFQVMTARPIKKLTLCEKDASRRGQKRKLSATQREDESSCCSSEDEERLRKRYPVLSPASSSCHSVPVGSPKPPPDDSDGGGGGTSVKDLEHAMSKHLPVVLDKTPTDFSTDTLLKQQQRSTIQWIGAHHLPQHSQSPGAPLPASALLRQLYANRESVIRANVHAGRNGGATSTYYSGDMNHVGPLPTPPGSEGSYSDQFVLAHNQKASDAFGGLVSSYPTTGSYTVDYHSAMTPPSSVSPRDKHQQVHTAFENPAYTDVLRHQYNLPISGGGGGETPAQPLPLKPQPYPVHPTAIEYASSGLDQSQFYHHSAGFHLYHPTNKSATASSSVYPETLKNPANWYSTPS